MAKDEQTIWRRTPVAISNRTKTKNITRIVPGPKGPAKHVTTQLESFFIFITECMIDNIVLYTNLYIENKKANVLYRRERDCKLTTCIEIQALFGVPTLSYCSEKRKSCKRSGTVVKGWNWNSSNEICF